MSRLITRSLHRLDALNHRLRPQHHAWTAAERSIVNLPMLALRPVANVVDVDANQPRNNRPLQYTLAQVAGEDFRKQGQHVDAHRPLTYAPSAGAASAAGASAPSAGALAAAAASAAISSFDFFGFGKLAGAPASGTLFGTANFSRAAFWAASCVPPVPYFLISTATLSDGN